MTQPTLTATQRMKIGTAFVRARLGLVPRPPVGRHGYPDCPFQSHFAAVLGSRLHYFDEGDGPVLVFLNDNPPWSYQWRQVIPYLSRSARVIAMDYLGSGLSDKPVTTYSYWTHLAHLEEFLDHLALPQMTFVGQGWGSLLAVSYARRHPERVASLVSAESFWVMLARTDKALDLNEFDFSSPMFPVNLRAMGWEMPTSYSARQVLRKNLFLTYVLPWYVQRGLTEQERAAYLAPYPDKWSRLAQLRWTQSAPLEGRCPDVLEEAKRALAWLQSGDAPPFLQMWSAGYTLPSLVDYLLETVPGASAAQAPGGYHLYQEDHPQWFAETVCDFAVGRPE